MNLKCDCCGFEREFTDSEEAFQEGWDAPPHFTGYVSCDLCPAAYIALGEIHKHDTIHKRWDEEGRPEEFTQETCIAPEDQVPQHLLEELKSLLGFE